MPTIQHDVLRKYVCRIFQQAGTPLDEAGIVSDHLVDANLSGHDSHGIIRAAAYARGMQNGVTPREKHEIIKESSTSLRDWAGWCHLTLPRARAPATYVRIRRVPSPLSTRLPSVSGRSPIASADTGIPRCTTKIWSWLHAVAARSLPIGCPNSKT